MLAPVYDAYELNSAMKVRVSNLRVPFLQDKSSDGFYFSYYFATIIVYMLSSFILVVCSIAVCKHITQTHRQTVRHAA